MGFSFTHALVDIFHYCANSPGKALIWAVLLFGAVTIFLFVMKAGK